MLMLKGILLSLPSVWYVCSVMIHYLNDRYYPYYHSQLYFTLSELYCQIVAITHISRNGKSYPLSLSLMGGTALSHVFQLLMDEPWIITDNSGTTFRNISFLFGDLAMVYCAWAILGGKRKGKLLQFFGICFFKLLTFHLFFADKASFRLI